MNLNGFLSQVLQLAIALALAPLLVGWVNQCRAWLSNRSAPSLLLPYRMIRKLFMKDAVVAETASPVFRITPYIVFGAMCCAAAIVPSLATDLPFASAADAIEIHEADGALERIEAWLRELWQRRGMPFPELNLKQAWLIPSAVALANPNGTAPGWL